MKNDVKKLLEDHKNLILSEASKAATNVPVEAMQIEAFHIAKKAAQDFDPSKDVKFSTYLVNSLKKLSRLSTSYGQVVRLPENQQYTLNKINRATAELEAELGRDPTIDEIVNKSGINIGVVNRILQNKKSVVNVSNMLESPTFTSGEDDEWVHFVYHDLSPTDKLIMEHKIGFGGKKVLNNDEISKKFKLSPNYVGTRVNMISEMIAKGLKN